MNFAQDKGKRILKYIFVAGLAGAISGLTSYVAGVSEGIKQERSDMVVFLADERYDACQNAKFARDSKDQDEILEISGAVTTVLDTLDKRGKLNDISDYLYEDILHRVKAYKNNQNK